jgi:DNA mismatch repair protein MutS
MPRKVQRIISYKLIQSFGPAEIIYSKSEVAKNLKRSLVKSMPPLLWTIGCYAFDFANEKLIQQFKTSTLKGFGIDGMNEAIIAAGSILHYLEATEHKDTQHIASHRAH